jgi:uncharacterized membrane protein
MALFALAFGIGVVAGLRTLTAPTLVSWAARLGLLHVDGTWLSFLGYRWTPWIFSLLAVGELVNDKLPATPSRKTPPQFIGRVITGSFSGAAITIASGSMVGGLLAGAVGAVAGTLGGAELRSRLVKATGGRDFPIALLEDALAVVGGAILLKMSL